MEFTVFYILCTLIIFTDSAAIDSSLLSSKITYGRRVTNPKEAYFFASLRVSENPADPKHWLHICGGCLISLKHILSAAQCIMLLQEKFNPDLRNAAACIGNLKLSDPCKRYHIKDFHRHDGYDENDVFETAGLDIGVILLEKKVMVTDTVNKIDLFDLEFCELTGRTYGFGSRQKLSMKNVFDENFPKHYLSRYLQKLVIRKHSDTDYEDDFDDLVNVERLNLMKEYGFSRMAQFSVGDAGNPLIVKNHNMKFVAGIATYIQTEKSYYPLFFVSVEYHRMWILETMDYLTNKPSNNAGNIA